MTHVMISCNRRRFVALLTSLTAFTMIIGAAAARTSEPVFATQSIAGQWEFRLDPDDSGTTAGWASERLPDRVRLPGSTDENKKTNQPEEFRTDRLSRTHPYLGAAWYSRSVTIPEAWRGKSIALFLERCHWETTVWVDGKDAGMRNSLSVPHIYDLTPLLTPGEHRLTIRIDNRMKIDVGRRAHSVTDETQTNWNGIIGAMELRAYDPAYITRVAFDPDLATSTVRTRVWLRNETSATVTGSLRAEFPQTKDSTPTQLWLELPPGEVEAHLDLEMPDAVNAWFDYAPHLYDISVTLTADLAGRRVTSVRTERTGFRTFEARGRHFALNGIKTYLRGTLECAIFPLTGYPPTDTESWRVICRTVRNYGLNHIRFHSWCPPESAFVAADREGVILQVECPVWVVDRRTWNTPVRAEFWKEEARRIVDTYGNHPSFCMMSLGNEILNVRQTNDPREVEFLNSVVAELKGRDPRRLYTATTSPYAPRPWDDFFAAQMMRGGMIRGQWKIGIQDTSTDFDWDGPLQETTRPVVSHEIGQYAIYPDFDEITSYTGVLRARNFEAARDSLTSAGMADLADDFTSASGYLSLLLYKDEIEAALRSRELAGFALLDLHDFPGQGTALVGMLNAFWGSKGFTTPKQFRQFCDYIVPLARLQKRTWTTDETLTVAVEMFNYVPADMDPCSVRWWIRDAAGKRMRTGDFDPVRVTSGGVTRIGDFAVKLKDFRAPARYTIEAEVMRSTIKNSWDVWVYPAENQRLSPANGLVVAHDWQTAREALSHGKSVLFFVPWKTIAQSVNGRFAALFWYVKMHRQEPIMGMLCDASHAMFADFPTGPYSDWQWLEIIQNSGALEMGSTPAEFRPIVQAVPDFNTNRKLGIVFEAKVGGGKLLACAADLETSLTERPAARQLRDSMMKYASSREFEPKGAFGIELLDSIFHPRPAAAKP